VPEQGPSDRAVRGREPARRVLVLPACVALLAACAGPPAPAPSEAEGCDWFAESVIGLREPDARDVVSASVSGETCESAFVMFSIRSEGRLVYRFDAPLPVFLSMTGDAGDLPEDAQAAAIRLVTGMVRPQEPRTVGSLPSWAAGEIDDGLRRHQYLLPSTETERLRGQPVFYHPAGFEFGYEIAVDPRAGRVVRVLESWSTHLE
jgi:hypothetical protein